MLSTKEGKMKVWLALLEELLLPSSKKKKQIEKCIPTSIHGPYACVSNGTVNALNYQRFHRLLPPAFNN